jgi:hypothetical protein
MLRDPGLARRGVAVLQIRKQQNCRRRENDGEAKRDSA